jgi:hypothetical protein
MRLPLGASAAHVYDVVGQLLATATVGAADSRLLMGASRPRTPAVHTDPWEWAPLGEDEPTDPHLPPGEYDWLVRGIERELDEGADTRKLAV